MDNVNSEVSEPDGEFAFETDHLVLRQNKDYCELLKYIVRLEAQKVDALQNIEDIADAQTKALEDPLQFVQDLKSGKFNFPPRYPVPDIPNIEFNRYGIDMLLDENESDNIKPNNDDNVPKVRGRKFTDNKPETFNQLWSCEEQKRLEELLEIFPEEDTELGRYRKIAKHLGTRTPVQVMSRVQKYFAKLAKAGLPIPGRAPKGVTRDSKSTILFKKSTFFPQLHVPVRMEDVCDTNITHETTDTACIVEAKNSNKSMLQLLKTAKEQRLLDESTPIFQSNTWCVGCQKTGFLGARWTDNSGTDFCTDCVVRLLPSEKLIPVRQPKMV